MLLQNDFEGQLESFFRLSNVKFTAQIARPFFTILKKKGIRLRVVLDNILDGGILNQGDRVRVLARAACDNLHQIIFIVQSETAAGEISRLNGDSTKISPQQKPAPLYRWSRDQTLALLNCSDDIMQKRLPADAGAEEVDGLLAEVLEQSEIPDAYGCWRPRSTKVYINTGQKPEAPLPIAGWGAPR